MFLFWFVSIPFNFTCNLIYIILFFLFWLNFQFVHNLDIFSCRRFYSCRSLIFACYLGILSVTYIWIWFFLLFLYSFLPVFSAFMLLFRVFFCMVFSPWDVAEAVGFCWDAHPILLFFAPNPHLCRCRPGHFPVFIMIGSSRFMPADPYFIS